METLYAFILEASHQEMARAHYIYTYKNKTKNRLSQIERQEQSQPFRQASLQANRISHTLASAAKA